MGKLTKEIFNESCCDGGECATTHQSARPCGCDPGANWVCLIHQLQLKAERIDSGLKKEATEPSR